MQKSGKGANGSGNGTGSIEANGGRGVDPALGPALDPAPAPARVRELAEGCVVFVERALGVKLDYEAETLSVLDHYLEEGRKAAREKPETAILLAHTVGAYFGEVVRRRYPSWWRAEGDDPSFYRIEFEPVYLSFSPVQLIADAIFRREHEEEKEQEEEQDEGAESPPVAASVEESAGERLELDEADQEAVAARLAELPAVSDREFYAPSTRLEVIDIAVDAIRARRMAENEDADAVLRPEDYEA